MRKQVLAVALSGLALPALALAAHPPLIRVAGHTVPVREVVRTVHTAAGPVRVQTWSWQGPDGATIVRVAESRGARIAMPAWAIEQMSALRPQIRQLQLIETALAQPLMGASLPFPIAFGQPLMPLPAQVSSLPVRFVDVVPIIPLRMVRLVRLPLRVIVISPDRSAPQTAPPAHSRPHGHLA